MFARVYYDYRYPGYDRAYLLPFSRPSSTMITAMPIPITGWPGRLPERRPFPQARASLSRRMIRQRTLQ